MKDNSGIISQVSDYYSNKLCEHGAHAGRGLEWRRVEFAL